MYEKGLPEKAVQKSLESKLKGDFTYDSRRILGARKTDVKSIAEELRRSRWAISLFPGYIRVVIKPHIRSSPIEHFPKDLKTTPEKLGG